MPHPSDTAPRSGDRHVELPAPTSAPIFLALGVALALGGLITNLAFSVLGMLIVLMALFVWLRDAFGPRGTIELALLPAKAPRPAGAEIEVRALRPGVAGYRLLLPEKYHPYTAGARGGLVAGIAMAVPAISYGLISGHGPWYPINLLAGMVLWNFGSFSAAELEQFHMQGLIAGTLIHGVVSIGLGLIYGVLLPTLPDHPIFVGGIVAPRLWTGAIYGFMNVLNPPLHAIITQRAIMPWFIASQFIYGLTVGAVIIRSEKVHAAAPGSPAGDGDRANPLNSKERS